MRSSDYIEFAIEKLLVLKETQSQAIDQGAAMIADACVHGGYATALLDLYKVEASDVLIIISNSGRNPLPVEIAMEAQKRGVPVIAITSMTHTTQASSRHHSGKNLYQYADVVIDNLTPMGDAEYIAEGLDTPTGATSTITGSVIIQSLVTIAIAKMIEQGMMPPVFKSSNVDGAMSIMIASLKHIMGM